VPYSNTPQQIINRKSSDHETNRQSFKNTLVLLFSFTLLTAGFCTKEEDDDEEENTRPDPVPLVDST
jgi:V8-like Glu-specific endopeptidase